MLAQLCLPATDYSDKSCVRIMGEPRHTSFDDCMFEGFDITQENQDILTDGVEFYYSCVDTFTIDSLNKYKSSWLF